MCKIHPLVDLYSRTLTVSAPGMPNLVLPLDWGKHKQKSEDSAKQCPMSPSPPLMCRDQREKQSMSMWPWSRVRSRAAVDNDSDCRGPEVKVVKSPTRSFPTSYFGTSDGRNGNSGGGGDEEGEVAIVRVCGNRRVGVTCEASASAWFTRFLGVPCSLVRAAAVSTTTDIETATENVNVNVGATVAGEASSGQPSARGKSPMLMPGSIDTEAKARRKKQGDEVAAAERAFANEAPYLLISQASVAKVNSTIQESYCSERVSAEGASEEERPPPDVNAGGRDGRDGDFRGGSCSHSVSQVTAAHFRPNFVVNGVRAHEEDGWRYVTVGEYLRFRVTGPCSR